MTEHTSEILQTPDSEWVTFPGGELEGKRPQRPCPACREALRQSKGGVAASIGVRRPLCFQCYRLELDRERALKAAGELDTASHARFQETLPLEPVDQGRLAVLKVERAAARIVARAGAGRFADRRRQAQIAARHALQTIAAGLKRRRMDDAPGGSVFSDAVRVVELQLPESWLPFVVSR
jgi:hypothetical protein